MYVWFWRHLPGNLPVKVIIAISAVALLATVLWTIVFPWLEFHLRLDTGILDGGTPGGPPSGNKS